MLLGHERIPLVSVTEIESREASAEQPERNRRGRRLLRIVRETALTLAALFGLLIAGITVFAARSGLEPLVVRSGSMEPTIETGSMILTKRVEAGAIGVGDVVTVQRPDRTRVTHRVIGLERRGEAAELTLKGDANDDPDPLPVTVREAQRFVWEIPKVGRAMAWLASAQGGFVLGSLVTLYATAVVRRRRS